MRIESIDIDDVILDKIESKHGIRGFEVEEACLSAGRHVRRGKEGLYIVFSRTSAGRYILVALADRAGGLFEVATAREMTLAERRLYKRATGG